MPLLDCHKSPFPHLCFLGSSPSSATCSQFLVPGSHSGGGRWDLVVCWHNLRSARGPAARGHHTFPALAAAVTRGDEGQHGGAFLGNTAPALQDTPRSSTASRVGEPAPQRGILNPYWQPCFPGVGLQRRVPSPQSLAPQRHMLSLSSPLPPPHFHSSSGEVRSGGMQSLRRSP